MAKWGVNTSMGNSRVHSTSSKGNKFGSTSKNSYNMKRALGMSVG